MHTNNYIPTPLDTSGIELSEELLMLTKRLAKNVHEVWAKKRMDHGWTYGPARDDANKKHPSLIPYEELQEEEKDYDRRTALESLKFIVGEGFKITR